MMATYFISFIFIAVCVRTIARFSFKSKDVAKVLQTTFSILSFYMNAWIIFLMPELRRHKYCWGDIFSSHHLCVYQYELRNGRCAYGLYSFAWNRWDRHTQLTWKLDHLLKWDHERTLYHNTLLNVPMMLSHQIISMVLIETPHMSLCLWFAQFCQEGTRETTAHTLLANWVTGRSETIKSTLYHNTLYHVEMMFPH